MAASVAGNGPGVTTTALAVATGISRRPRRDRYALAALAIGAAGLLYRVVLLAFAVPPTNSDEATIGLATRHIATGRDFPVFFYGQHYMGVLEAYLAAPLTLVFGQHDLVLRLPPLAMYAGFLLCVYRLARRLYSPGLALFTVALLALGSDRVVKDQLLAGGGYPEITFFGALLMLLAVRLAGGDPTRRGATFTIWGLVAGLCLWVDWLVLPYLAASAWLIVARCRDELRGRRGVALLAGLLVGAAPVLGYNLAAAPGKDSISVFLRVSGGDGDPSLWARLYGGVLYGVPMATGLCSPGHCRTGQLWWGFAYPVLLTAALVGAVAAVRRSPARHSARRSPDRHSAPADVRDLAHLALLVAAAASLLGYVRSACAGQTPVESARYLSCLLISTPAVLRPLWSVATRASGRRLAAAAPLALLMATAVLASAALVAAAPGYARRATAQDALVAALRQRGLTRIYSGYWTCDRLAYATREQVVCAVLGDDLRPGQDRYAPYRSLVAHAPRPAYVLPVDGPLDRRFAQVLADTGAHATVTVVAGYRIYQPDQRVPVPAPPRR